MTQTNKTFRVFVSSTFSDLKAERNALQAHVFPRLRELCEGHGARFQPIDLRWGVSDEAALDQQAMKICLSEILRCQTISPRPNFIILLGNRYGWRPLPNEILEDEYARIFPHIPVKVKTLVENWYQWDENAVPAEYFLQARMPELISVPTKEFERFVADPDIRNEDREIAIRWYEPGQMKEPVSIRYFGEDSSEEVYTLKDLPKQDLDKQENERSRAARIVEGFFWQGEKGLEPTLHAALESAARKAILSDAEMIKYHTSATEQEIIKGAIQVVNAREHIFCFTREIKGIPLKEYARDFIDLDHGEPDLEAEKHLLDLKSRLTDVLGKNYHEYPATWVESGPSQEHIDKFSQDVYDSLAEIIKEEVEKSIEESSPQKASVHFRVDNKLDGEGRAHQQFAEERLSFFVGRKEILSRIAAYLQDNGHRSMSIVGAGGTGKSALMAKTIEQTFQSYPQAGVAIVYRFIGATPTSSDGRSLLESLCREISRRYGVSEADIPMDYSALVRELGIRMHLTTAKKPLILFLDSLDQLSPTNDARSLTWLPSELPEHVSVITSTREEDTFENLRTKQAQVEVLEGLEREEGDMLLSLWLKKTGRKLQDPQKKYVLDKFKESRGNPLYLKLAFEEARLWTSYSGETPEELVVGVRGIIENNMFDRLKDKTNHGEELVSHALGYLAASRNGLSEDELVDLLSRDFQVYDWFFKKSFHLPADLIRCAAEYLCSPSEQAANVNGRSSVEEERAALAWLKDTHTPPEKVSDFLHEVLPDEGGPRLPIVLWSRLYFDLSAFLNQRTVNGSSLLNFYHRELKDAAKAVFLADGQENLYRTRLADYFDGHRLDRRKTDELPWQLTQTASWQKLHDLLADLPFFEACFVVDDLEVQAYWAQVEGNSLFRLVEAYQPVINDPAQYSEHVTNIAILITVMGHPEEALALQEYMVEHYRQTGDQPNLQAALNNQAAILHNRGDLDGAMALYKEQERICRELRNRDSLITSLNNQAIILHTRGDLDGAMALHKEHERICRQLGYRDSLQRSLGGQANILITRGDLDGAMALYKEQERICRELGNKDGLSKSLSSQGVILVTHGDPDRAMALFKEHERICRELGNKDGLSMSLGNQAIIQKNRGAPKWAMALHKEEERICRELGNKDGLQRSLGNQAGILITLGDLDGAMALLNEQEHICRELGNKDVLAASLINQALILGFGQNQFGDALSLADEAYRLAVDHGNVPIAKKIEGIRSNIVMRKGK
jgi:tetratricopeptide (TPR) repeat protein